MNVNSTNLASHFLSNAILVQWFFAITHFILMLDQGQWQIWQHSKTVKKGIFQRMQVSLKTSSGHARVNDQFLNERY